MKANLSTPQENSFGRNPFYRKRFILAGKGVYWLKAHWRHFRISPWVTRLLGPQYRRSRSRIEIDITYACNLKCFNCNRSVRQAPERLHMPLSMIEDFVEQSIKGGKQWQRIRVLGGEPTVHPKFLEIINVLCRYREWNPSCLIEVVSNGHGEHVKQQLEALPASVWVENSSKESNIQPSFGPFNDAPQDDVKYANKDFTNACAIVEDCGMGLTPLGYYPCAVAGGIDRILKKGMGTSSIPEDGDDMRQTLAECCRLCGRFRDGHFVPSNLRPELKEEIISKSWVDLYASWKKGAKKDD